MKINSYNKKTKISADDYHYAVMGKESFNDFNGAIEEYTNANINDKSCKPAYIGSAYLSGMMKDG
jgi:hypothetical protein